MKNGRSRIKNRVAWMMLCAVLGFGALTGCGEGSAGETGETANMGGNTNVGGNANSQTDMTSSSAEDTEIQGSSGAEETQTPGGEAQTQGEAAQKAYMDFLQGSMTARTAESFREDEKLNCYEGIPYGTYSLSQLQETVRQMNGYRSVLSYAFVDFGGDGVSEMVLRCQNVDPSYNNQVFILHYDGSELEIAYTYTDGYRTYSRLDQSGYLSLGGSMGAGSHIDSVYRIDGDGKVEKQFDCYEFMGAFVPDIRYYIGDGHGAYTSNDYSMLAESDMCLSGYVAPDGAVSFCVTDLSEDKELRDIEEMLVDELIRLGARQVSPEEMERLTDTEDCFQNPVEEIPYRESSLGNQATIQIAEDTGNREDEGEFHYCWVDTGDYAADWIISTDSVVYDFKVVKLLNPEFGEDGEVSFEYEVAWSLLALFPGEPLSVKAAMEGTIPGWGIAYVDPEDGAERFYSVNMSGEDGHIFLTEAEIRR